MTNKTREIKRIVIFLLLCFIPPVVISIIYGINTGWSSENKWFAALSNSLVVFPALANIITRIITREGFENNSLDIRIRGKQRYYIAGLALPVLCTLIIVLLGYCFLISPETRQLIKDKTDITAVAARILYGSSMGLFLVFAGLGEELGWRGYLTPKLKKLMPLFPAVMITGLLWGIWYIPLVISGYAFGKEYSGYPWVGIVLIILMCVFTGIFLTALTKAAGSVLPAAASNIAGKSVCLSTASYILCIESFEETGAGGGFVFAGVVSVLSASAGIFILLKNRKKEKLSVSTKISV